MFFFLQMQKNLIFKFEFFIGKEKNSKNKWFSCVINCSSRESTGRWMTFELKLDFNQYWINVRVRGITAVRDPWGKINNTCGVRDELSLPRYIKRSQTNLRDRPKDKTVRSSSSFFLFSLIRLNYCVTRNVNWKSSHNFLTWNFRALAVVMILSLQGPSENKNCQWENMTIVCRVVLQRIISCCTVI